MARIVIVTYGSLGDLHPALALAHGLQARGHAVTLATSEPYRSKIAAAGVAFHPVRPDLSLTDTAMVRRVMDGAGGSRHLMRDLVYPNVRAMYDDLRPLVPQTDFFLGSELACALPLLGERTGARWGFAALSPISFFSLHDPPLLPGPGFLHVAQSLGPLANRWIRASARAVAHAWARPVRTLRRELGLGPGRSPVFEGKHSPHLNLALFSRALQAPQRDWPARTVQTGFPFFASSPADDELPPEVERFLAAGDPPIVFTLGSAAVSLAGDFYAQGAAAARTLGRRALLLTGHNPPPAPLPASILAWDYLPYARIFPRAAAIVHQGGIGTTAEAMRAGKPMLIVPFAHDQFDNAARAVRLGVARTLARSRCQAPELARRLSALTGDPAIAGYTASVRAQVAAETGVAGACAAMERALP
jgi:UDP:flavonoid glycosyltransferase YjiC (YdhE family)